MPEWQGRYTQLTASPAPRKGVLSAQDLAAHPDLALIIRPQVRPSTCFRKMSRCAKTTTIREDLQRSRDQAHHQRSCNGDVMRDLQAELSKRIPLK